MKTELSDRYKAVIGLEIHVQLKTKSKIFCADDTAFGAEPNSQVSIVSLAHPGTLPKLNKEVVPLAVKMGLACGCAITRVNIFDRKHYFYPDSPQGYQITQQHTPICVGGAIPITIEGNAPRHIPLNRIHLEADAGKLIHDLDDQNSLVDLNRAGMPLIEMVTEPAIHSAEEAGAVMEEVRKIVRFLNVSDGNMEEGSLRCDANISVREKGATVLGQKVEIKNMNSIRYVKKAIEFEINRQSKLLESGGQVESETRLFDVETGTTRGMRFKEEAQDYRYFADPDLPSFVISEEWLTAITEQMEPLPSELKQKLTSEYGLSEYDASVLTEDKLIVDLFENLIEGGIDAKIAANWIMGPVKAQLNLQTDAPFLLKPQLLVELVNLVTAKKVNYNVAVKQILPELVKGVESSTEDLVNKMGLAMDADEGDLADLIKNVIDSMPKEVEAYKNGKKALLKRFMGEVMKRSKGKAEPQATMKLLNEMLSSCKIK